MLTACCTTPSEQKNILMSDYNFKVVKVFNQFQVFTFKNLYLKVLNYKYALNFFLFTDSASCQVILKSRVKSGQDTFYKSVKSGQFYRNRPKSQICFRCLYSLCNIKYPFYPSKLNLDKEKLANPL